MKIVKVMRNISPLSKNDRSHLGFTLVELLVTISIIGILAALLFASIPGIIAAANKAGCISNLRQDGIAFHTYASDNDGNLPPNPDPAVTPVIFWMGAISPYLNMPPAQIPYSGQNFLKCPAASPKPEWQTYTLNGNIYPNATPVNFISETGVKMVRFRNPSKLVLLFDGGDGAVADGYDATTMGIFFIVWRHPNNTANFLMVDGSVSNYSKTSDIVTDDSYWIP